MKTRSGRAIVFDGPISRRVSSVDNTRSLIILILEKNIHSNHVDEIDILVGFGCGRLDGQTIGPADVRPFNIDVTFLQQQSFVDGTEFDISVESYDDCRDLPDDRADLQFYHFLCRYPRRRHGLSTPSTRLWYRRFVAQQTSQVLFQPFQS